MFAVRLKLLFTTASKLVYLIFVCLYLSLCQTKDTGLLLFIMIKGVLKH